MITKTTHLLAVVLALFALNLAQVRAECIVFTTDGVIEDGDIYECVQILNDATVNMTGGWVMDYILLTDSSTLNFSDGWVDRIEPNDYSTVNMSGGEVERSITAHGSSTVNISAGSVEWDLWAHDSTTITISGGSIAERVDVRDSASLKLTGGWLDSIGAHDSSTVNITGGDLRFLYVTGSSLVNIYRVDLTGSFALHGGTTNICGGNFSAFLRKMYSGSTCNIYGYDFNYDPNSRLLSGSLMYGGRVTLVLPWSGYYEWLNLVVPPPGVPDIVRVIRDKTDSLPLIDGMLHAEQAAYDDLDELLQTGDYGDLTKSEIVKAKQKIHAAIQHEHQSKAALEKSIEKLNDALDALNWHSPPYEPLQH